MIKSPGSRKDELSRIIERQAQETYTNPEEVNETDALGVLIGSFFR